MSKKIQLTIPKPCHENWEAMTPVEKGKFCGSCQKQVVDFSTMSDRQVAEFFKKPSTGSVCGRFMTDQLDREIDIPKKRIPWVKYFFQILLPAFFVSKASAEKTQGKIAVKPSRDTVQKPAVEMPVILGEISTRNITPVCSKPIQLDSLLLPVPEPPVTGVGSTGVKGENVIRGTVVDDSGLPLPGATVMIKNTRIGMATEINGFFAIKPPRDWKELTLVVSYIGFMTKEIVINAATYRGINKIELVPEPKPQVIVGAVVQYVTDKMIKGMVIDETGDPLPGVYIKLAGTNVETTADNGGLFSLKVKKGDIIQVQGAGLEQTRYTVTDVNSIVIVVKRLVVGHVVGSYVVVKREATKKELRNVPVIQDKPQDTVKYFKVFPNPLPAGSNLTIEWKQSEEGYFNLQLLNASGQITYQQEIWIDADARLLNIDLPRVAAGNYFLLLISKKSGKRFTEKLIIQ